MHDPRGPKGIIKFRLADEEERKKIRDYVLAWVEGIDVVADNCFWMPVSNELLQADYPGKAHAASDAHGNMNYTRHEIGRASTLLSIPNLSEAFEDDLVKRVISHAISSNEFRTDLDYTPPLRFAAGVAFGER